MRDFFSPARPAAWLRALALGAFALLLQAGGEPLRMALRLDRQALAAGEWWRVFSAHFVHLGWAHAALNVLGILLCCCLAPELYDRHFWRRIAGLALGVGLCLWWGSPGVQDYVGLSGVLYGMFALGLLPQAWRGDRAAGLALAGIAAWMLWQWGVAPSASEEAMIGGRIVGIAHVYGFLLGMAAMGWRGWRGSRRLT
ncbi:rhombosortase [Pollutimonas bauzanensis]|uniref:Rhomboid family GlyGly-CTERM serine protease n=1 Tax=Pollutimonas bauzanensis TaxID=658167 RepID=A0A1M5NTK9_9BURK|nr:rhombosortase [Pollutimonas bauzanensis]SHG92775.1 rhomboid family GlyGly-CTERM serine protease [Pollutimonas bauzanensis]